ncbi:aspartic peptidase domain-containing protein [Thelonectria olida]|uniref:Aspartic peptidase domain-containing protein n=1 Tax=Thelonectria olida TaxID=1576542 RepID=A0A9P9AVE8_9HYPO|nr:aspartic peptidase domain-containing protein [Thelonectria olida]
MKFFLLVVTAIRLVNASPLKETTDQVQVDGWWEDSPPPGLETRSVDTGKKFTLPEVENTNYKDVEFPFQLLRVYYKYNAAPPKKLLRAARSGMQAEGIQTGSAPNKPTQYYDAQYVLPVKLGTPGQLTYMNLDTGSSDLWTFSTDTATYQQAGHTLYRPKKSTTSKLLQGQAWDISYGDGSGAYGIVYKDKVQIGNTYVQSQAVESAQWVSSAIQTDTFSSGLMGMAFKGLNTVYPTKQNTYAENVASSLASPVFTANLKKQLPGTYNFGYINKTEYTGSLYYTRSVSEFWEIVVGGYQVGTGTYKSLSFNALVDTGTTLLLLPQTIVTAYYSKVAGAKYDNEYGAMLFPCKSTLPDFKFGLGAYRGLVPGNYMNYGPLGDGRCFGGLQSSEGLDWSILGDILLKAQFVVFNIAARTVGFANKPLVSS